MLHHKRLKYSIVFLALCFLITGLMLYTQTQPSKLSKMIVSNASKPKHFQKPEKPYNFQEHKQIQLMTPLNNNADNLKKKRKIQMDHDPYGVMVHSYVAGGPNYKRKLIGSAGINKPPKKNHDHRLVHLDLKGAPLKISYLKIIFPLLKSLGSTGILVEYEDMFPYWGTLQNIPASNAYTKEDILLLISEAEKNELEYIPLIQTFGHMEFILKLKEFSNLREVPNYPQSICPTNNGTFPLITTLITQIMELHPGINWLHIGLDEVYNLGECNRCQRFITKKDIDKEDFFLEHAVKVSEFVKNSFDVQPIMWDDQLRKIPLKSLLNSEIGKVADIMVWQYNQGILASIGNEIWEKYADVFQGVWVASAFKGAARPDSFLTDVSDRLSNTKEWAEVLNLYKESITFRGITLTGWQRFDHFAVLSELFPQAIPSLAVSLSYLINKKLDHNALSSIGDKLGCDSFLNMDLKYIEYVNHCSFPGSKIYEVGQRLYMLKKDVSAMLESNQVKGWITNFNIKHKFSSPQLVEQGLQDLSMLLFEYRKLYRDAENALSDVYDCYTVAEWLEINLEETVKNLNTFFQAKKDFLSQTIWPRRPLIEDKDKEL